MTYDVEKLKLDKFDHNAFEHSVRWLSDEYIIRMICAPNTTRAEKEKWFKSLDRRDDFRCWLIKYDTIPIGVCGLKNINREAQKCEYFGYIGEENFRGRGLGNRLMCLAKRKAKALTIKSLYLKVRNDNIPALKLYKKHGFVVVEKNNNMTSMILEI